ncbi:DUF7112 family protein [Natronobiforma cellulositropha]|uniref:DUF7112 family protein n=1 Tax=Natronobiforma cellulositropha TaxID=1679076 RepID=UPI0021D5B74B|nr:hypothetical protein [Natronobiforma cellulositropha]
MADRISSDHPSVHTVRATLAGTATGVRLDVPEDECESFPLEEVVRTVLDGEERFALVARPLAGGEDERVIDGVYDAPRMARDPREGVDRLASWASDHGVGDGSSVLVDVVEPGFLYGLRAPGETAYYDAREPPKQSLADIAKGLEESDE